MAAKRGTPYDPAKDVIVHKFWSQKTGPTRGNRLVLRQYNGGKIKLAYEECWVDARTGEPRRKCVPCPTRVLVDVGIVTPEITAAAAVEPARSEPDASPEDVFEL